MNHKFIRAFFYLLTIIFLQSCLEENGLSTQLPEANSSNSIGKNAETSVVPTPVLISVPPSSQTVVASGSTPVAAKQMVYGVNIHSGGDNPGLLAEVMAQRNLKSARMDYWGLDAAYVTKFRNAVNLLKQKNISVEAVVQIGYGGVCSNPSMTLEQIEIDSYKKTYTSVNKVKDIVYDFEMQNEVTLYAGIKVPGADGRVSSHYATTCGYFQAAVLRGMSRAIDQIKIESGLPLRRILGLTSDASYGFITFMEKENKVNFDVLGFHIYPFEFHRDLRSDPWYGSGGAIGQIAILAAGRPIHINEFNCAETYTDGFMNKKVSNTEISDNKTELCLLSLNKHIPEVLNQTMANIESLSFYEIVDRPNTKGCGTGDPYSGRADDAECRFGLMHDLSTPKPQLLLITAYAGGQLSSSEITAISELRKLLTPQQIQNFKSLQK